MCIIDETYDLLKKYMKESAWYRRKIQKTYNLKLKESTDKCIKETKKLYDRWWLRPSCHPKILTIELRCTTTNRKREEW